jgi:Holliday junction resolvasome RuvABC DNA-binding subunit
MTEHTYATDNADFQNLLSMGFSESEAAKLVYMKDHVTEQIEYREILKESRHLDFIRWLIEHDRISK